MPDEPLIFVQVALVEGLADNVQVLLDVNAHGNGAEQADCAIFYSISNCQRGLAGVGFGDFLVRGPPGAEDQGPATVPGVRKLYTPRAPPRSSFLQAIDNVQSVMVGTGTA